MNPLLQTKYSTKRLLQRSFVCQRMHGFWTWVAVEDEWQPTLLRSPERVSPESTSTRTRLKAHELSTMSVQKMTSYMPTSMTSHSNCHLVTSTASIKFKPSALQETTRSFFRRSSGCSSREQESQCWTGPASRPMTRLIRSTRRSCKRSSRS